MLVFAPPPLATAWERNMPGVALLMAVAFGGLLRSMEAMTLHQLTEHASCTLITSPSTKSGKRTGVTQSAIIEDSVLVSIINHVLYIIAPDNSLLLLSVSYFRVIYCDLTEALGLSAFRFKPYSQRRGGATIHLMLLRNMDATIEKGRWSCF